MPAPKKRDPVATRARLLDEAIKLFAEQGYDKASTRAIVEAAGVTDRMLFHYFGDKRALYREVFVAMWKRAEQEFAATAEALLEHEDFNALMHAALDMLFDFMIKEPTFVRLMMWDALEGGGMTQAVWNDTRGPFWQVVRGMVAEAQKQGAVGAKVDIDRALISFIGITTFYFAAAPTLDVALDAPAMSRKGLQKERAHLHDLLTSLTKN